MTVIASGKPRPHKYGAERATVGVEKFSSKREARRWADLQMLQRGGEIRNLRRQVKIALIGKSDMIRTPTGRIANYVADFVYFDCHTGCEVIEDSKGFRTKDYLLKKAILAAQGVKIVEV